MQYIALGLTLLSLAGFQEAKTTAEQDRPRLDKIAAVYTGGKTEEAITQLKEYLESFARDDLAWTILGHAYKDLGRMDEAQASYESALNVNSRQFQAITGQGIVHRTRGEYDKAMKAYERAVEIDPKYAQAYSSMTTIALKQKQDKKALEFAKKGYELDKTDPVIAANLAIAYHYNNDKVNRDKLTQTAKELGYAKVDTLLKIYSGELTVRD